MKNYFFIIFYLFTSSIFAQNNNDKKIFLDSLSKETTEGNHKYYRIIKDYNSVKDNYKLEEYYKSGVKKLEGTISDKGSLKREGEFIEFYENGNKESLRNYLKSIPTEKEIEWYENGNKKSEAFYTGEDWKTGKHYRIDQYWDEQNNQTVINGNGFCNLKNNYATFYGNLKNGYKDGIWKNEYIKFDESFTETYENGKFISGILIDSDKISHYYTELESQPSPKKGLQDFYNYLGKNIKVPRKLRQITGRIIIEFIVDKEGKIVDPTIIKSLNSELDDEAIKVLLNYENWIAGRQKGRNVKCKYSLPLNFKPSN